ncbi:MAG: biotin carboxylase N-terminal domain-containing protein [Pseudomonadota bacterium]
MFSKLLIANRGEIAVRVIRSARAMGIATVAVYSEADAKALHVELADEAVWIGPPPVADSYLRGRAIIEAARKSGAEAIHPGYGFLSENADFVDAVEAAGLTFVGPSAQAIRAMGLKDAAKALMETAEVPVVPGYHGADQDPGLLAAEAETIGYPILIKARAGGGGRGIRLVVRPEEFQAALESAAREAQGAFGDPTVIIEKFVASPRHIEVQVFGDRHGNVVHLFERDCSLQRRHQKVVEEAPAPGMTSEMRAAMAEAAVRAAKAIDYVGAGTVEFIVDGSGALRTDGFWFMEMNTRLQVEHPVTEAITGVDLVEIQLRVASGETLPFSQGDLAIEGHAVEARLYAEDVAAGFLPASGGIREFATGHDIVRIDTGIRAGDRVTPLYDPMIAKLIAQGPSRAEAFARLRSALRGLHVAGPATNRGFLLALLGEEDVAEGAVDTGLIERRLDFLTAPPSPVPEVEILAALLLLGIDPAKPFMGWRLWGAARHPFRMGGSGLAAVDRTLEISSEGWFSTADAPGAAIGEVEIEGALVRYATERQTKQATFARWTEGAVQHVSLLADGAQFIFYIPDPLARASENAAGSGAILSPMTGTVTAILTQPGTDVAVDQPLLALEAMKMEIDIRAPVAGVLERLEAMVGQTVEGGAVIGAITPEAADG